MGGGGQRTRRGAGQLPPAYLYGQLFGFTDSPALGMVGLVPGLLWLGPTGLACSAYPRADVVVHPAIGVAGGSQTTANLAATGANPGECPGQTTTESGTWARYRVGAEAAG